MNDRTEVEALLVDVDRPRNPSSDFDQRLHAELFGSTIDTGDETESERPGPPVLVPLASRRAPRTHPRRVAVAAVAAAAAIILVVSLVNRPDARVSTGDQGTPSASNAPSAIDLDAARAACGEFSSTAFAPYARAEVIGPANGTHLTTLQATGAASAQLRMAFDRLLRSVADAHVDTTVFQRERDRIHSKLDQVDHFVTSDELAAAIRGMGSIENMLIDLSRQLTERGVSGCG